jgi:sugar lactone lactonase YvrE
MIRLTGSGMFKPELLVDGFGFLEGPRWFQGALWVSDFVSRTVHKVTPDGNTTVVASTPGRPSGLGFAPDGSLMVCLMERQLVAKVDGCGEVQPYVGLGGFALGLCNDMLVDSSGRAYVGSMGFDVFRGDRPSPGNLMLIDEHGSACVVAEDLLVPNGTVMDSVGRLIVAESNGRRLTSFIPDETGRLHDRRVMVDLGSLGPDGICIDAADGIWVGACFEETFVYVLPSGRIAARIPVPGRWAVACALGGEQMTTLYLLSAQTTMRDFRHDRSAARIDVVTVEVPGNVSG